MDGLNPAFFQTYWSIDGRDVVEFFRQYMSTGELPNGINKMLVCLIPKIKVPQRMTDYALSFYVTWWSVFFLKFYLID